MVVSNREIFLKKKNKKYQYTCERYRNLWEDENERLDEYRKIILECKKYTPANSHIHSTTSLHEIKHFCVFKQKYKSFYWMY